MIAILLSVMLVGVQDGPGAGIDLEARLRAEIPRELAAESRRAGDPRKGAILFYRPTMICTVCHATDEKANPLGPNLATIGKTLADSEIVESILEPSKTIARGFQTVTILDDQGQTTTGFLDEETPQAIVVRDPASGRRITIPRERIDEKKIAESSLMPAGLARTLTTRAEFLDLARYVMEIAEKGPARARELRPDPSLVAPVLPDYEHQLDHAALIKDSSPASLERGRAIYDRVCANCHGDHERAGSLPTAPRFTTATLKTGGDPYAMYRVLTDGQGQMPPQTWMVPQQKYDAIHWVRENYLKARDPAGTFKIDQAYLDRLPKGTSRGPAPSSIEAWSAMDYGPSLSATYEIGHDESNYAYKGIAIRLDPGQGGVSRGRAWAMFDIDTLRLAASWTGEGFIDWNGINFNGRHQVHPRIVGTVTSALANEPGWANPDTGSFADDRVRGRDGRRYGPINRRWGRYLGRYLNGDRVILAYMIGSTKILETYGIAPGPGPGAFTRTLEIGPAAGELVLRVAGQDTITAIVAGDHGASGDLSDGFRLLRLPASSKTRRLTIVLARVGVDAEAIASGLKPPEPLEPLTGGGPAKWPEILKTQPRLGASEGPFAVDILTPPESNPWLCQTRLSGLDFFPDGRSAAVCSWDGDVWKVEGVDHPENGLAWRRIASGLFQPLGLRLVDGIIHVGCRDQIVRLHDQNGDGEIDFYENFNSDHQVTDHFHEFALDLQTDQQGNFYYAKAARHGLKAVVPQHGTLLKVDKTGSTTEILATGFRAPNGVCLNPDGTFFVTDQEGFWIPKNCVDLVKKGSFHGNMWGYHDVVDSSDAAMAPPVCWITNAFDRSPAELLWVTTSNPAWKPLAGAFLSLSYGNGKVFVVLRQQVGDLTQGGMCALPIPAFPTGVMRGRFHPTNGELYVLGLYAWAGDRTAPGGFYRIRATGKPIFSPIDLRARPGELVLRFTDPVERESAGDPDRYHAKTWALKRSAKYGSDHLNERPAPITGAKVSSDGLTVTLAIPDLRPTWCMELEYDLKSPAGSPVHGVIDHTIHSLGDDQGSPR